MVPYIIRKEVPIMGNPGVITEQAYPAGQGGFKPLSEQEREMLEQQKQQKGTASK